MEVRATCKYVRETTDQLGGRIYEAEFVSLDGVTIKRMEVAGRHVGQFEAGERYTIEIREA